MIGPERVLGGGALGEQRGAVGDGREREVPPRVGEAVPALAQGQHGAVRLRRRGIGVVAEQHERRAGVPTAWSWPRTKGGVRSVSAMRGGNRTRRRASTPTGARGRDLASPESSWPPPPRSATGTCSRASPRAPPGSSAPRSCAGSWPRSRARSAPSSRSSPSCSSSARVTRSRSPAPTRAGWSCAKGTSSRSRARRARTPTSRTCCSSATAPASAIPPTSSCPRTASRATWRSRCAGRTAGRSATSASARPASWTRSPSNCRRCRCSPPAPAPSSSAAATSACCAPAATRSSPAAPAPCTPPTRSAAGSGATCTTARSSGSSCSARRWTSRCAS